MHNMSRLTKLGLVLGGYMLACLAAGALVAVYQQFTRGAAAQASAGMYGFGDLVLFTVVCGVLALLPTGLAVYFLLRRGLALKQR